MKKEEKYNLKRIVKEYQIKKNKPIYFDFKKASESLLKEKFERDNRNIHYIHYYPGRIYPYIPLFILSLSDLADLNGYVLDPFSGSGTILLESIINPVLKRNAFGIEINPIARLISKVKTNPIDTKKINKLIDKIYIIYSKKTNKDYFIPEYKNINLWFSKNAINKLSNLKYAIEKLNESNDYMNFFWVCFSNIVRKASRADPNIPPPVILKPEKYENNPARYKKLLSCLQKADHPDIWSLFKNVVNINKDKLNKLSEFQEIKNKEIRAEIIWDDAKKIKKGQLGKYGRIDKSKIKTMPSNSIDIIFTSPPYLTAQKYIRTNRLELLWLGYDEKELYNFECETIGTEKTFLKTKISELGLDTIDSLINNTYSRSRARGLMVYNYFRNMLKVFKEMYRILKQNGYAILVVGNNKVLRKRINTYKLLTDEAKNVGFEEIVILRDEIRTRSMITKRNGTGGLIKDEYIIILKKGGL